MPATPTVRSANMVRPPSAAGRAMAPARPSRAAQEKPAALMRLIDVAITGLVLLAVVSIFTISSAMLTNWKIHYLTAGGNFYEKLHPATYLALFAFCLLLIRNADPVGDIVRMFSGAPLLLFYLLCWFWLLVQMLVIETPFTVIIDTFLLPLLLCLLILRLSPTQRRPLVWAIHLAIPVNIIIGYYEYFSGHRLIP